MKSPDLGEVDDLLDAGLHVGLAQAQHGGVHVDVLPPGEDGVEAGAQGDERPHAAPDLDAPRIGLHQSVEHAQQRGLAQRRCGR
jgi:hypothetical protein